VGPPLAIPRDRSTDRFTTDGAALLSTGYSGVADRLSGQGVGCAPSEDFLDAVSGTLGLAGSVDTVITLKRTRAEGTGALGVTGRDVAEMVYPLTFDDGVWKVDGTDLADAANKVTQRKLSEKMRAVLELVNSGTQTTAADVTAILGITDSTPRQYLRRLADEHGLIDRVSIGTYGPVTVSTGVTRSGPPQFARWEGGRLSRLRRGARAGRPVPGRARAVRRIVQQRDTRTA
jgi:hypothetical protein